MENNAICGEPKSDSPPKADGRDGQFDRCQWCNELSTTRELHEEADLGLLCDSCIRAIESRGEALNLKS